MTIFSAVGDETYIDTTASRLNPSTFLYNDINIKTAFLHDGSQVVVYLDNNLSMRRFNADGTEATEVVVLNAVSTVTEPEILPSTEGFLVVWKERLATGENAIRVQKYDFSGATVGAVADVLTTTTTVLNPNMITMPDGRGLVTWEIFDGFGSPTMARFVDGDSGAATGAEFQLGSASGLQRKDIEVAALSSGQIAVVWLEQKNVNVQLVSNTGADIGAPKVANLARAFPQNSDRNDPAITALEGGGFVATWWGQFAADGNSWGVFGRIYDANGVAVGDELQLNTTTDSQQWSPEIAGLPGDGFMAVWQSFDQDDSGEAIVAQSFLADGTKDGEEFVVNKSTGAAQWYAAIDANDQGQVGIVWQSHHLGARNWQVMSQRFQGEINAGDDTLIGDESANLQDGGAGNDLIFGDGAAAAYYGAAIANQVYRIYQATLDRMPDATGHLNWTTRIATGERTLLEATEGFVGSPEFQQTYNNLTDSAFVTLLYNNVLDTNPDAQGLARWTGELANGASRAEVVMGFAESPQFTAETQAAANRYAQQSLATTWSDDVFRLYQATLDRAPDVMGQTNWSGRIASGERNLLEVAEGFVASPEFQAAYQNLDNTQFVTLLYNNVLDTNPDDAGLARWTGELANGASRAEVVLGFSQSPQFTSETQADLKTWMRDQGQHDRIEAGTGNNVVAGGQFADVFVFHAGEQGSTTVLDFEAWDYLQLDGFGYNTLAHAKAQMSQSGSDLIFTDQGVEIVFNGTTLEDIAIDTFLDTFISV